MSIRAGAARAVRGPYRDWGLEVALRYQPAVRILRSHGLSDFLVEVGSGNLGITPYTRRPAVGVDMGFAESPQTERLRKIAASTLQLPFADAACPCVVSLDMLEHIPPPDRAAAVTELVRVTKSLLVLGVPQGEAAEAHDQKLAREYQKRRGVDYPFFVEHVEYGLPRRDEFEVWLRNGIATSRRSARLELVDNSNLRVRESLMRLWVRGRAVDRALGIALLYAHPILTRLNFGTCYRVFAVVEFDC